MKVIFPAVFAAFAVLSTLASAQNVTELGFSYSSILYVEPDVMHEEGNLYGIQARFVNYSDIIAAIEVDYAFGYMDYEGSGTIKDIPDSLFEMRALFGPRLFQSSYNDLHAYVGIGQRYLSDDSSGMRSSTGAYGYSRQQYYWYIPIGINLRQSLGRGVSVSLRAEYDYFLMGRNFSGIDEVCGGDAGDFRQFSGEGFRVSANVAFPLSQGGRSMVVEPYYRTWEIDDSETRLLSTPNCNGNSAYYLEPHNTSDEAGVALRFVF